MQLLIEIEKEKRGKAGQSQSPGAHSPAAHFAALRPAVRSEVFSTFCIYVNTKATICRTISPRSFFLESSC